MRSTSLVWIRIGIVASLVLGTGTGCSFTGFAAGSTIGVLAQGSPALSSLEDPDLVEDSLPGSIGTMEALLAIKPESGTLRSNLARAYCSLGFGFLEERMERALEHDDEENYEHFRRRASLSFKRAKEVGLGALDQWQSDGGGHAGAIRAGLPAWAAYLQKFNNAAEQVPAMFWGAYGWARYISNNKENPDAVADLPFVIALVRRVNELDATYYDHAPPILLGGMLGSTPRELAGEEVFAASRAEFERGITASARKNLMYLVQYARIWAVSAQDRALYTSLLNEVINAGDIHPAYRISNLIAKRRAERYLRQVDDLIAPSEEAPAEDVAPDANTETRTAPVVAPAAVEANQASCSERGISETMDQYAQRCPGEAAALAASPAAAAPATPPAPRRGRRGTN